MPRSESSTAGLVNTLWYGRSWIAAVLIPVSLVFRVLVALRRLAYRFSWLRSFDVGVPVVVIGNLTVGGTGKTPLVIWLAERLRSKNLRVGIICRGYGGTAARWPQLVDEGADPDLVGDEARLLALRSGAAVAAGPDRVATAKRLLDSLPLDVILSDDGLQHYRLKRCFEIAVVDGTRGFGNGHCLPAGPLREPTSRLRTVDAVVVNQGDLGPARARHVRVRVREVYSLADHTVLALADFSGRSVHAVAAIGNPARFFDLLSGHGLVVDAVPLPDHARLDASDLEFDDDWPVLITEKDAVKCGALQPANVWCVAMDLEFLPGDGEWLESEVVRTLEQAPENR